MTWYEEREHRLRLGFRMWTAHDFTVLEEVEGRHLDTGAGVRADLVCHASAALQARGFPQGWFVVETKFMNFAHDPAVRVDETLAQAKSYGDSEFRVDGAWVRPLFDTVLINAQAAPAAGPLLAAFAAQQQRWEHGLDLVARMGTGHFDLYREGTWTLKFGQGLFFDSKRGPGEAMREGPHGLLRQVGSRLVPL